MVEQVISYQPSRYDYLFSDGEALYCAVNCTKPLDQSAGTVLQLTEKRKHPPGTAADVLRKRVYQSRGFMREKVVK